MEEGGYAANGVKHCVRPCDMMGKSAAIILRNMHNEAIVSCVIMKEYCAWVWIISWFADVDVINVIAWEICTVS